MVMVTLICNAITEMLDIVLLAVLQMEKYFKLGATITYAGGPELAPSGHG